jgi:hypothetical protein
MPSFDITDGINSPVGTNLEAVTSGSSTIPDGLAWECEIAGLKFLTYPSDQYPFKRETATFRRDRIDTERNPGEQSLDSGYWLRSQSSWHYGSGLSSAEPLEVSDAEAQFRFKRGGGVDPWTPGQVTLLKDTSQIMASAGSTQYLLGVDTGVLHADGTTVSYVTNAGSSSAVTWGGASAVTSLTSDGANYYAANTTGIYKGTLPSGAGSKIWDTGATTLVRWVKSRLFAAVGLSLYELTTGGPTLPTALYTHPATGWTWTDFAEGPAAIYAAGYTGDQSYIYKITVTSSASSVVLSQPVVVADMPRSERVLSLYSYVGTYLVVGTNKGVRVALIQSDGSISLGPLIVQSSDGCQDAVADGSFVYVTMGSNGEAGDRVNRAGLWRIDLGTNLNNSSLDFANCADLVAPSGTAGAAHQVTIAGDLLWFTATTSGLYRQSATDYVSEGWLETGRIRLGTVETKAWRALRVLGDSQYTGSVEARASASEYTTPSTWTAACTATQVEPDATGSLTPVAAGPLPSIYLSFRLVRASATVSPRFIGYQLKAVPAPRRSELLQVPLLMFDWEMDAKGARYGHDGNAWERFQYLKTLESSSATVNWRDFTTGESAEAYIEQITFTKTTPPTRKVSGHGGIATVLLRLV